MKNQITGKYEAKKVLKKYDYVVTGVGDTKEEAKADLKKKLEALRIPGTNVPGYNGPKFRPPMKVVGYINSPGFVAERGEDGKVSYVYKADRKTQVLAVDRDSQTVAESAKVNTEEK